MVVLIFKKLFEPTLEWPFWGNIAGRAEIAAIVSFCRLLYSSFFRELGGGLMDAGVFPVPI